MINHVIILCLDKRRELWEDLTQQCIKRGWTVHQFFVGDGTDGRLRYRYIDKSEVHPDWRWGTGIGALRHYNAFRSHKEIVKYAIRKELPNFLLLEDDVYILDRHDAVMSNLHNDIFYRQIDLLYLGWHAFEFNGDYAVGKNHVIEQEWNERKVSELLPVNFNVGGFHAVWINNTMYARLLNLPAICPMDSQCNTMRDINRYMITPKIFHTVNTFSYCENKMIIREVL